MSFLRKYNSPDPHITDIAFSLEPLLTNYFWRKLGKKLFLSSIKKAFFLDFYSQALLSFHCRGLYLRVFFSSFFSLLLTHGMLISSVISCLVLLLIIRASTRLDYCECTQLMMLKLVSSFAPGTT